MTTKTEISPLDKSGRRKRLPAWLYCSGVITQTYRHAWASGVEVLVLAAESGASLRRTTRGHLQDGRVFYPTFDTRVASLPARLGIDVKSVPTTRQLVNAMIAALRDEANKLTWDLTKVTSSSFAHQLAQAHRWWRGVAKPVDLSTPVTLMRTAFAALEKLSEHLGTPGQSQLMALALIGMAERGLQKMHRCEICFRWSIPGQPFCHEHSRSATTNGALRERDVRRQIDKRFRKRNSTITVGHGLAPCIYPSRMPIVVGRILWDLRTLDETKSRKVIQRDVKASVHLRALIGPYVEKADHHLLRQLRARIDPFEFDLAAWGATLQAAQAWLETQTAETGRRGLGVKSRVIMLQACQFAEMGMNRQEVAQALKRTPTAIGQWLRRYADPAHPLNDLAKRLEAALAAPRPDKLRRTDRTLLWQIGELPRPSRHD